MGQLSVISVIGALLLSGLLIFNAQRTTADAGDELSAYHVDRLAREAVQVGLKQVERNLTDHIEDWEMWTPDPDDQNAARALFEVPETTYGDYGATYSATLDNFTFDPSESDKAWVSVRGTLSGWNAATSSIAPTYFRVQAVYEKGMTDVGVPPAFRFAILAEDDLDLIGSTNVVGAIHTNSELLGTGNGFTVNGPATYTEGWDGENPNRYGGCPDPECPPQQSPRIEIPPIDFPPATYHHSVNSTHGDSNNDMKKAFALNPTNSPGTLIPDGWFSVTGKGTKNDPYVLYVNGNLRIDGDVRLPGYVRIYVDGNFEIGSNAKLSSLTSDVDVPNANEATDDEIIAWRDANFPDGSQIGLYINGKANLDGTPLLAASVFAEEDVIYKGGGNKMVVGGVVSRGQLVMQGNPKIYHNPASASIWDPGIDKEVPEGIRLIAYREWVCRPDSPAPGCS